MVRVERIVDAGDFERVLKAPTAARTQHFAVHHVSGGPRLPVANLSTDVRVARPMPVDERSGALPRLGYVVPKRHARRAVTRSLLKRQIRAAVDRRPALSGGLWVVRLRLAFDRSSYPSAASAALARAASAELDVLLSRAERSVGEATAAPAGSGC